MTGVTFGPVDLGARAEMGLLRPSGAGEILASAPTACAVGCILWPLRGWAGVAEGFNPLLTSFGCGSRFPRAFASFGKLEEHVSPFSAHVHV